MTENEIIDFLEDEINGLKEQKYGDLGEIATEVFKDINGDERIKVFRMAISAIKEIEQYREIGTVEECRRSVEKQNPTKPEIYTDTVQTINGSFQRDVFECPVCGEYICNCVDGCEEYDEEWQESEDNIMMDAVKYLKERKRMCDSYNNMCEGCGFGKVPKCDRTEEDNPEKAVEIVEKWSAEHPEKTRQSEILKIIPDATIKNGILMTKPCEVNEKINDRCKKYDYCLDCRKEYWLAEVE